MSESVNETFSIEIKRRPWYEWALWVLWAVIELFVLQNALASSGELEPRAASIFWIVFVVLLIAGGVVAYMRRSK